MTRNQHRRAIEGAMDRAAGDKGLPPAEYIDLMNEVAFDAKSRAEAFRQEQKTEENEP